MILPGRKALRIAAALLMVEAVVPGQQTRVEAAEPKVLTLCAVPAAMPRTATTRPARRKAQKPAAAARSLPAKTLPLRELLRRPLKVKQLIAAGHEVRITDNGKPLWRISDDGGAAPRQASTRYYASEDAFWDELLSKPVESPSMLAVLEESRR